jgi:hypothetical protein
LCYLFRPKRGDLTFDPPPTMESGEKKKIRVPK